MLRTKTIQRVFIVIFIAIILFFAFTGLWLRNNDIKGLQRITKESSQMALPTTLIVTNAGNSLDNGSYTLVGPNFYSKGGATTGTGPGIYCSSGCTFSNNLNYATGAYSDNQYSTNGADPTGSWTANQGALPPPTVAVGSGGTGSGGTTTITGVPSYIGGGSGSSIIPSAPTGVTATLSSGGVTVTWTPPAGYTGTGYNVYRLSNGSINGVPRRIGFSQPFATVPWGTNTFTDRTLEYPPVSANGNIVKYFVTTFNSVGLLESLFSTASNSVTYIGG